jgi:GNAT superfamily N-acetyltransferase
MLKLQQVAMFRKLASSTSPSLLYQQICMSDRQNSPNSGKGRTGHRQTQSLSLRWMTTPSGTSGSRGWICGPRTSEIEQMHVRQATASDSAEILEFVRSKAQFDRQLGAFTGELGTTEDLIRRHLFGPRPVAFALLAGASGNGVGFALYYFRYSSFRGRPSVWLDDLFVHPSGRRQGAGRLLMGRLAEEAITADCSHIAWVASASNAAGMNFYHRIGAAVVHQAGDAVTLQIEPECLLR